MGFSKQECWSGLPFPSPGDLPNPGIEPGPPAFQEDALPSEPPRKPINTYCAQIEDVSDIKLIRTDTTLDLSQKAKK